jgi:hypothetical protein
MSLAISYSGVEMPGIQPDNSERNQVAVKRFLEGNQYSLVGFTT